jgi:hypothetical protein
MMRSNKSISFITLACLALGLLAPGLPLCGAVKKMGRFFSSGFKASRDA